MVRQSPQLLLLLVAGIIATVTAGPTGPRSSCAFQCTNADRFSYKLGNSYIYDYTIETSTDVLGAQDGDASSISVFTRASIDVASPCELILRLNDVSMKGSSRSQEFATELTKTPLRFSFQDGKVEHICAEVNEPAWVLNFKKGIISTFQSSMTVTEGNETVVETDISGICKTHYSATNSGDKVSILKTKDIKSCTERPEYGSHVGSSSYASDSPVQSLPIVNSEQLCQQQMQGGILQTSECTESHKFRPFSSEKGGAVTTTKITMALNSQERTTVAVTDFESSRMLLLFDHSYAINVESRMDEVEKVLHDLEMASEKVIRPEVPALFAKLVTLLKGLQYPELNTIFTSPKLIHTQKFLVDAMPMVGTPSAAGIVRDMILKGEISNVEADIWLTSLAFVKTPTLTMFTSLAPLLENEPSQKAMLGISALVNNYCLKNEACGNEAEVQLILRYLETNLGSACRTFNDEEKVKIMVALKAIGNVGRFVNVESILRRCYTEEQNDIEVRIAAIQAWRHTPCEYDRTHLLGAFQDENQDTEIRIAAYLALMTCPNPTLINNLKDRLTSEGVNQVGSFIWSHMVNLQESAAPGKQWVRELIGEELLQKKFSTEALKYSRNYESSIFTKELNAGAAVESNVIFSKQSFLPRSAMLNLTLDLFGESINLFEVGGRIEGFEMFIERFFGQNGYYPEETIEAIIKNMRQKKTNSEETMLDVALENDKDEPEGSYYLKVFGNDLHYKHFQGLENFMDSFKFSSPLELLMTLAQEGDVNYSKSYNLIDNQYTIPTISGFPVILKVNSTATLEIKMNGNFNAVNMKNINIEGSLRPSAAVEMDTSMAVDAYITKAGIKMISNLYSSTVLDGKLIINGGKLVDISINTPEDKVEIIDVSVAHFRIEDDKVIPKSSTENPSIKHCTNGAIGIALCGEYTLTTPTNDAVSLFALENARIFLQKTDSQSSYVLKFTHERDLVSFLVDTPGSAKNHKISFNLAKADTMVNFELTTPNKNIQGNGEYKFGDKNKNAKIEISIDGGLPYTISTSLQTSGEETKVIEPTLYINSPSGEVINMKGNIQFRSQEDFISSKAELEYNLFNYKQETISHFAKIKKESSGDIKTFSVAFTLTPSAYQNLDINFDWKTQVSSEHLQNTGKLSRGPITWSTEQLISYNKINEKYGHSIRFSLACPLRNIDLMFSNIAKISPSKIDWQVMLRTETDREYSVSANFMKESLTDMKASLAAQCPGHSTSIDMAISTISDGYYKAQIRTGEDSSAMFIEATIQDQSTPSKLNVAFDAFCKCFGTEIKFQTSFSADERTASGSLDLDFNTKKYYVKAEGTANSLDIDANIFKPIVINTRLVTSGEEIVVEVGVEWDREVKPLNIFTIQGKLSKTTVMATYRYGEEEAAIVGKLIDNGLKLETKWAADKMAHAKIQYSLNKDKYISVIIETPFLGWEKQDATFSFNYDKQELKSQFESNWKNKEQISITLLSSLIPAPTNDKIETLLLFTSTVTKFERLMLSFKHDTSENGIKTNIEGNWNSKIMKGDFSYKQNDNITNIDTTFTSPLTKDFSVTICHKLLLEEMSTVVEQKYGEDITTITFKGHIVLDLTQDINLVVRIVSPTDFIPKISVNINYTFDGSKMEFMCDGKLADEKKMMMSVNGETKFNDDSTVINGNVRVITPITLPLIASLSHKHEDGQFSSDFKMSSIWSTSGSFKVNAEGHKVSNDDLYVSFTMENSAYKVTSKFNHKLEEASIKSSLEVSINDKKIAFSVNGSSDHSDGNFKLNVQGTSNFEGNNSAQISLSLKNEQELKNIIEARLTVLIEDQEWNYTAKGELQEGLFDIKIETPIESYEIINLIINYSNDNGTTNLALKIGKKTFIIDIILNEDTKHFKFTSPLEIINTFSITVNYILNEMQRDFNININHNEQIYKLVASYKVSTRSKLHLEILTPFVTFSSTSIDITYDLKNKNKLLDFNLTVDRFMLDITAGGSLEDKTFLSEWNINAPITGWSDVKVVTIVDFQSEDKIVEISLDKGGDKKAIYISGKMVDGSLNFNLKSPFNGFEDVKMQGSLDRSKRSVDFIMQNDMAQGGFIASFNSIKFQIKTPYEKAREIDWEISLSNNGEFKIDYKRNDNYAVLEVVPQGQKKSFDITIKSEFPGWEFLAVTGRLDQKELKGYLSGTVNEEKTSIQGKGSINAREGKIEIKIETPYEGYEHVDVTFDYNGRKKAVKIEAKTGKTFHFIAELKGKFSLHLIVPNPETPTEVTIDLSAVKGKVDITSRFPRIQTFHLDYEVKMGNVLSFTQNTILNGVKVVEIEFEKDTDNNKGHLQVHGRRGKNHSMFHFHREGWNDISAEFNRNGKELKIVAKGSGELPDHGQYDVTINNSFREVPRTITARIFLERRTSPKTLKVEVELEGSKLYIVDIKYNAVLGSGVGDYKVVITTPQRYQAPWKSVSGSWDLKDPDNINLSFEMSDGYKLTASGKLGIRESDINIESSRIGKIFLQWRFKRENYNRDYYLKVGPESRYLFLQLKGSIENIANADIEAGFRGIFIMKEEFHIVSKWSQSSDGTVTGSGSFNYGTYSGTHELKYFKRNAATRSASFSWEALSNIPNFSRLTLVAEYSFDHKILVNGKLTWDVDEVSVDFNLANFDPTHSNYKAKLHTPSLGDVDITLSHDFINPLDKSINIIAKFGDRESSFKAHWTRTENFDKISGNLHIESKLFGSISITEVHDFSDINNAHAELTYSRNENKHMSLKISRKSTSTDYHSEAVLTSDIPFIPDLKLYANAEFENGFALSFGGEGPTKNFKISLDVKDNSVDIRLESTREGFEEVTLNIKYNLKGKNKSVTLNYARGEKKVDLDFNLSTKGNKEGEVKLSLTTPFEVIKEFEINGSWKNKKGEISYRRNDINYSFSGNVDYQGDQSSIDLSFKPDGKDKVKIAASYNIKSFLAGTASIADKLASVDLELDGQNLNINIKGFRNIEKVFLEIDCASSFPDNTVLHIKLDSELNLQSRDGIFEIQLNDFFFKVHNHFELRSGGFYFKSEFDSSLTPLPGLTIGVGREDAENIFTIGYGNNRELTVSFKPKDSYLNGFSGKLSLPYRGINNVKYEAEYEFKGDNELQVEIDIELNDGEKIEVEIDYDSDGVKARLSSPFTGSHHARARRSITNGEYSVEAGFDDYNLKLRGGIKNEDTKRGLIFEADFFGDKILVDVILQSERKEYIEGKLVIHTPFAGFEKFGGDFTWTNRNKKIIARTEIVIPSQTFSKITGEITIDFDQKLDLLTTVNLAGTELMFKVNIDGNSTNGYRGNINILTPFDYIPSLKSSGYFKIDSFDAISINFNIETPFWTHELTLNHKIEPYSFQTNCYLNSSLLGKFSFNFIYDSRNGEEKLEISVCEHKLIINTVYNPMYYTIVIDSVIMQKHRQMNIDIKYPSIGSREVIITISLDGKVTSINGNVKIAGDVVKAKLYLESDFMKGNYGIEFTGSIPNNNSTTISYGLVLTIPESHSFQFELTCKNGLNINFNIDSRLFTNVDGTIILNGEKAEIILDTPIGIHTFQVLWNFTNNEEYSEMSAMFVMDSPLHNKKYSISGSLTGSQGEMKGQIKIMVGEIKHALVSQIRVSENGGEISIFMDTPYKQINNAKLHGAINFDDIFTTSLTTNYANIKNSLTVEFNKLSQSFSLEALSPVLPAGSFMVRSSLTGTSVEDMTLVMSLKHGFDTMSGTLNLQMKSSKNFLSNLEIITVFDENYKMMNFGASYRNENSIQFSLYSEAPMRFRADINLLSKKDLYLATFKIETTISMFDKIKGELNIPLNKFQPKMFLTLPGHKYGVSAEYENTAYSHKLGCNLALDSDTYSAQVGLRNRGPYELSYDLRAPSLDKSFHLRTDSSFISAFI